MRQYFDKPDVMLFQDDVFEDERGFFQEIHKPELLFYPEHFVQTNHSRSKPSVVRGLHYQIDKKPVAKLVRCISGEIFDVAVDLRPNSSTFKKWAGFYLSGSSGKALYIPEGFAHGFCVTSDTPADVIYKVTTTYSPTYERIVRWNDPEINISWHIKEEQAILSHKDANAPLIKEVEFGEDHAFKIETIPKL